VPVNFPTSRPRLSASKLITMVSHQGINFSDHPLIIAGIRGYYKTTMGDPTGNDSGIYDDAIFILTANMMAAFNGNTDPSKRRAGHGFAPATKGMARLQPGAWLAYKFAQHAGPSTPPYDAICQRAGDVTVLRDGTPDYLDTGSFGMNIHKGQRNSTSSEGCQTIYPDQWLAFIISAQEQGKRIFGSKWKSTTIPYVLMTN